MAGPAPSRPRPDLAEWLAALGWIALAAVILVSTARLRMMTEFGPGPRFFSFFLSLALLALAAVQLAALWRRRHGGPGAAAPVKGGALLRFALLAAAIFVYAEVLEPLGFLVATALLTGSVLVLLGRPWRRAAVEAAVSAILLYGGFTGLLDIQLPAADLAPLRAIGL